MKISDMLLPISIYRSRGWQILIPHDDMKISDMLLPISIYSSRGWRILIPHDDTKISDMLLPISIYIVQRGWRILIPHDDIKISDMFKRVADFNPSWWYEDIWHFITHFNIEFKGVADFNPSWWHEDQVVIPNFNIVQRGWQILIPQDILTCYDLFLDCRTQPLLGSQVVLGTGCLPSDAIAVIIIIIIIIITITIIIIQQHLTSSNIIVVGLGNTRCLWVILRNMTIKPGDLVQPSLGTAARCGVFIYDMFMRALFVDRVLKMIQPVRPDVPIWSTA